MKENPYPGNVAPPLGTLRPTSALEKRKWKKKKEAKLGLGDPRVGDPRQELLTGRTILV